MNRHEKRVRRGAAYLDAQVRGRPWHRYYDWRNRIDVEVLDLNCANHCVVGQLTRNFHHSIESAESNAWLIRHGFVVPGVIPFTLVELAIDVRGARQRRERQLRQAWIDYITSEREVKAREQVA